MKRTWTIIGVTDVRGSYAWYQSLFGQPHVNPDTGTDEFSLRDPDGYHVTISASGDDYVP